MGVELICVTLCALGGHAQVVKRLLESNGIPVVLITVQDSQALSGSGGARDVRVMVRAEDVAAAEELLAAQAVPTDEVRRFRFAITQKPGATFAGGLTTAGLGAPVLETALAQHAAYCDALRACGLDVMLLEADPDHPDSTFVEDVAVLTPGCAILTRPGAPSRQGEVARMREPLAHFFGHFHAIQAPGTLDGGDICEAGLHYFIGLSARTNEDGARQLAELLAREGYLSTLVDIHGVPGILHLKSGLAYLGDGTLVATRALAEHEAFHGYRLMVVDDEDAYAANCVRVNDRVLLPAGFPRLEAALRGAGYEPVALEMSEFRKMDGGLSCLSLRF